MTKLKMLLCQISFLILCFAAHAQQETRLKHYNVEKGVAIMGYDPVAYFNQKKAVKGKKEYSVNANGIIYYLSSQANKDQFQKNYTMYEPQYGGWCAYAMGSTGEKVEIDPETFKIIDSKLYLFYHTWTNNTLTKWNTDETRLKIAADKNWSKIYH